MKTIHKIAAFVMLLIFGASCTDEINPKLSPNGLTLNAPDVAGPYLLSAADGDNTLATLNWSKADSGVETVSPKYTVEIAKAGTNFAAPITASLASTELKEVIQEGKLNSLLLDNGFKPETVADIDIRIKSVLGENVSKLIQYSNPITIKVTPFSQLILALAKVGSDPATAPRTKSSSLYTLDSEGYAYLEAGTYRFYTQIAGEFKTANASYGDNGNGTLALNGAAITVATDGFYMIKATTGATPTYSITPSEWAIFGTAKPNPTGVNLKMQYKKDSKKWEIEVLLNGGKILRFRNTGNTLTLGAFDDTKPAVNYAGKTLTYDGKEITIAGTTREKYRVTLDLNTPREYTYTLTQIQ